MVKIAHIAVLVVPMTEAANGERFRSAELGFQKEDRQRDEFGRAVFRVRRP
jgi:hypothetical protein